MSQTKHVHDQYHNLHGGDTSSGTVPANSATGDPSAAIDWRQRNAVTPVQAQGGCGSCWAFSALEAIEGQIAIRQQRLVQLSKQFLVDCDTTDFGCDGGWVMNAFAFVEQHGGIPSEQDYPYNGGKGPCQTTHQPTVSVSGSSPGQYLPQGDEAQIQAALIEKGPISVSINADDRALYYYSSGVYRNPACNSSPSAVDHAVLIVGFNNTNQDGGPYWIVKNSWGTSYGEQGYVRMAKGVNQCGIANWAMYPTMNFN